MHAMEFPNNEENGVKATRFQICSAKALVHNRPFFLF